MQMSHPVQRHAAADAEASASSSGGKTGAVNASMDSLESPIRHLLQASCSLLTSSHDTAAVFDATSSPVPVSIPLQEKRAHDETRANFSNLHVHKFHQGWVAADAKAAAADKEAVSAQRQLASAEAAVEAARGELQSKWEQEASALQRRVEADAHRAAQDRAALDEQISQLQAQLEFKTLENSDLAAFAESLVADVEARSAPSFA
ncbi:hypothetical protein WJX73_001557 [Symbiochloris irregularis]|uniref:Uncharacterized protein n=1 Tax=Symbiochloris irregularis TaxID=706552 RepID=A0AAW1PVB1_9CHLO